MAVVDQERRRQVIGDEWYAACRFSLRSFFHVRWAHRGGRVPPLPQDEEAWSSFIKQYSRGRGWHQVTTLFHKHYEVLADHPVALAFTLMGHVWTTYEEAITGMIACVDASEHAAWIMPRAIGCGIECQLLDEMMESDAFLDYVRAHHREKWITLLWDLGEEEAAGAELVRVAIEDMTRDERRVWMWVLMSKGELDAVEENVARYPDPMTSASLLHRRRKYAEAARFYEILAQSEGPFERRFGEQGLREVKKRLRK